MVPTCIGGPDAESIDVEQSDQGDAQVTIR